MIMAKKKTWLSVLLGIAIAVFVLCIAAVGGGVYWFYQHVQRQPMSRETAADEFSRERARFAGQTPLVDLRQGEQPVVHRPIRSAAPVAAQMNAVHFLVYDPSHERLIRASIPMWAVRLAPKRRFGFVSDSSFTYNEKLVLNVDDLEARGPGLILDATDPMIQGPGGGQVLIWAD